MAELNEVRSKALQELRKVDFWQGRAADGEWIRESICCDPVKRTFERHTRNNRGEVVKAETTEIVYQHDGYRPKFKGEKKTRKSFFWRGARVWRD